MKNLLSLSISSLLALSLISGCSTQEQVNLANPALVNSANADFSSQYIITAQALIDKIPSVSKPEDRAKIKKDFERELKTLNRYALEGLVKYAVKVLQANLKPGQDIKESPVIELIYSVLNRMMDVYSNLFDSAHKVFIIAIEKDPKKIEAGLVDFEKFIKKLAKADLKNLVKFVNGENSNLPDFLPIGSPLHNRVMKIIEDRIKATS